MVKEIEKTGYDGVIANRWLPGGGLTNHDSIKDILNWIFQKTFSLLFWTSLGGLTFGFKILSKKIADSIEREGTLHEICIETTMKPITHGNRIHQIPTVWVGRKEGARANTFFRNFRYVKRAFRILTVGRLKPDESLQR